MVVLLATAVSAGVLAQSSAGASKPAMERYQDSFTFFIARGDLCNFRIRIEVDLEGKAIVFEETADTFHASFHERFGATWTNVRSGKTIIERERYNIFVEEDGGEGTITFTGVPFRLEPVKGSRFIIKDVGRVTFDAATGEILFEAGPHPSLHIREEAFAALLCGALS